MVNSFKKLKIIALYCFVFFLSNSIVNAQVSEEGNPYSKTQYFQQVIAPSLDSYTTKLDTPSQDVIEDDIRSGKLPALPFAKAIYVDYDWNNSGKWIELPNGDRLWILNIKAENAVSLHFMCDSFELPEGARMFVLGKDEKDIQGAFTSTSNKTNKIFTLPVMDTDELTIEYYEPKQVKGKGSFHIHRIDYGFQPINWETENEDAEDELRLHSTYGVQDGSGTCNINIRCPIAENWQEHKKAVARVVVSTSEGSGLCSGALINNTLNDGTPYFQLAWHCERVPNGETINYENWQFRFNFEAIACLHGSQTTQFVTTTGCTFKARVPNADYVLVEIDNLPEAANPYFLGWDRGATPPSSAVGIHHPGGNPKKFSFTNGTVGINPSENSFSGGFEPLIIPAGHLWTFSWAENGGTTQGGSSGSPLLNQDGRSIGVLTGGNSSCSNQQGFNAYGRFFSAWQAVKSFLDPINSEAVAINAYDPNAAGPNDLGVIEISTDVSECAFTEQTQINYAIRNFGTADQSNVPVSYEVVDINTEEVLDNGNLVLENSFPSGQTQNFSINLDLSVPRTQYKISISTQLLNDEDDTNNEKDINLTNKIPTIQAQNILLSEASPETMRIQWTSGNGEQRLVLMKEASLFTANDYPNDGVSVPASSLFGTGGRVGNAYAVFRGTGNSVIVTGLTPGIEYSVSVIELSCNPPVYLRENLETSARIVTSLNEPFVQEQLNIFPNPTSEEIFIDFGGTNFSEVNLELFDMLGAKVIDKKIASTNKTQLDVSKLSKGIYILKINFSDRTVEKKISIY